MNSIGVCKIIAYNCNKTNRIYQGHLDEVERILSCVCGHHVGEDIVNSNEANNVLSVHVLLIIVLLKESCYKTIARLEYFITCLIQEADAEF